MTARLRQPQVTDSNGHNLGKRLIWVEFDEHGPTSVRWHQGERYYFTGKTGANLKTGLPVREMATAQDARIWVSLDVEYLWED